mmetsp:Transcript_26583/g.58489  ORF Transcript_26583/g.58489 Transcript_26583/m.58489 type:complete len:350 (-) Transcript_26583:538-1587(-)
MSHISWPLHLSLDMVLFFTLAAILKVVSISTGCEFLLFPFVPLALALRMLVLLFELVAEFGAEVGVVLGALGLVAVFVPVLELLGFSLDFVPVQATLEQVALLVVELGVATLLLVVAGLDHVFVGGLVVGADGEYGPEHVVGVDLAGAAHDRLEDLGVLEPLGHAGLLGLFSPSLGALVRIVAVERGDLPALALVEQLVFEVVVANHIVPRQELLAYVFFHARQRPLLRMHMHLRLGLLLFLVDQSRIVLLDWNPIVGRVHGLVLENRVQVARGGSVEHCFEINFVAHIIYISGIGVCIPILPYVPSLCGIVLRVQDPFAWRHVVLHVGHLLGLHEAVDWVAEDASDVG